MRASGTAFLDPPLGLILHAAALCASSDTTGVIPSSSHVSLVLPELLYIVVDAFFGQEVRPRCHVFVGARVLCTCPHAGDHCVGN